MALWRRNGGQGGLGAHAWSSSILFAVSFRRVCVPPANLSCASALCSSTGAVRWVTVRWAQSSGRRIKGRFSYVAEGVAWAGAGVGICEDLLGSNLVGLLLLQVLLLLISLSIFIPRFYEFGSFFSRQCFFRLLRLVCVFQLG